MLAEKPSKRRFEAAVSNVLTLNGSKLFLVCICFFNFYDVVDGLLLRCSGSGIGSVWLIVSNTLTLDGGKLLPVCICFLTSITWGMDFCCVALAVALDLCRCLSGTCGHRMG